MHSASPCEEDVLWRQEPVWKFLGFATMLGMMYWEQGWLLCDSVGCSWNRSTWHLGCTFCPKKLKTYYTTQITSLTCKTFLMRLKAKTISNTNAVNIKHLCFQILPEQQHLTVHVTWTDRCFTDQGMKPGDYKWLLQDFSSLALWASSSSYVISLAWTFWMERAWRLLWGLKINSKFIGPCCNRVLERNHHQL